MIITYSRFGVFINFADFIPFSVFVVNFEQVNVACACCMFWFIRCSYQGHTEKKKFLKVAAFKKIIFQSVVFLIKILKVTPSLRLELYKNRAHLHSAGKSFPETPLETPHLIWCIFVYIGKNTSLSVEYYPYVIGKNTQLQSVSDYYFPVLNDNNSLCISSIQKWSSQASCLNLCENWVYTNVVLKEFVKFNQEPKGCS